MAISRKLKKSLSAVILPWQHIIGNDFLKGTWGQSNNFCLKWSFFIIKQNDMYKKLQKFTCKPQLTYFVCSFVYDVIYAGIQFNRSRLCNFTSSCKMVKNTLKHYYRCFLHKSNKKCKENQGLHVLYICGCDATQAECKTL